MARFDLSRLCLIGLSGALTIAAQTAGDKSPGLRQERPEAQAGAAGTAAEGVAAGASIGASAARGGGMGTGIGAGAGAAAGLVGVLLSRGPDAVLAKGSTVEMVLDRPLQFNAEELDFSGAPPPARHSDSGGGTLPSQKGTGGLGVGLPGGGF